MDIGFVSLQRAKNGGLYRPVSFVQMMSLADLPAEMHSDVASFAVRIKQVTNVASFTVQIKQVNIMLRACDFELKLMTVIDR